MEQSGSAGSGSESFVFSVRSKDIVVAGADIDVTIAERRLAMLPAIFIRHRPFTKRPHNRMPARYKVHLDGHIHWAGRIREKGRAAPHDIDRLGNSRTADSENGNHRSDWRGNCRRIDSKDGDRCNFYKRRPICRSVAASSDARLM